MRPFAAHFVQSGKTRAVCSYNELRRKIQKPVLYMPLSGTIVAPQFNRRQDCNLSVYSKSCHLILVNALSVGMIVLLERPASMK